MYTRTRINLVNKPCRNDVKFHPKWLWHSVRFKMINHSVLLMSQLYVVNKQKIRSIGSGSFKNYSFL